MTRFILCGHHVDAAGDIVGLGVTAGPSFMVPASCAATSPPGVVSTSTASPMTSSPGPPPALSGVWVAPSLGSAIKTTKVTLSAKPSTSLTDVNLTKLVYSIAWGSVAAKTACVATKADDSAVWSCSTDLTKIGAPPGQLTFEFDVLDDAGDVAHSPDGARAVTYAPPAVAVWTKPQLIPETGDCGTLTAGIDTSSGYHIAAACSGTIRYLASKSDGSWSTTVFSEPPGHVEANPQLAFWGNMEYLAYTRFVPIRGCAGPDPDYGVFYRRRTLPNGAWSNPVRLGPAGDGIGGSVYLVTCRPGGHGGSRSEETKALDVRTVTAADCL